ncbi:unnamed protein product, partial [Didymodactylos carnosus]
FTYLSSNKMAGVVGDDEEQRVIDRIRANAYREAMEEGATFINRKWIAQKLHRTESDERYQDVCAKPNCIEVVICFTAVLV